MTIQRLEHVGIVVDDLGAATAFFVELGLEPQGKGQVEGGWVDRVVGLKASGWSTGAVPLPLGPGPRRARAGEHWASAMSHSPLR